MHLCAGSMVATEQKQPTYEKYACVHILSLRPPGHWLNNRQIYHRRPTPSVSLQHPEEILRRTLNKYFTEMFNENTSWVKLDQWMLYLHVELWWGGYSSSLRWWPVLSPAVCPSLIYAEQNLKNVSCWKFKLFLSNPET